ncbi:MAG: EutN/CcmL family microcompartment protein [Myxococcota bacterium]
MKLCRVLGTVVSTVKHETYVGRTLLVVQPVDERGEICAPSFLAVDVVQAGVGDLVLVGSEGGGTRQVIGIERLPMRSLVLGVVDRIAGSPVA